MSLWRSKATGLRSISHDKVPSLLSRHSCTQVIVLALRIVEHVVAVLHMLAPITTETLCDYLDQAFVATCGLVSACFPPHCSAQRLVLDVLNLFGRDLRRVIGYHGLRGIVVAPACDCLFIVAYFCTWAW